eukprot:277008_1
MNEQLINNGMVIDTDQKNQEIDSYPIQMQDSINYINNNLDKSTYLDINDFVDEKDKENKSLANDGDINGGNNNDKFPLMLDITHNENELTTGNILIEADENDKVNDGNGIDMDIHLSIAELKQQLSEINSHENDDNEMNKTLSELESSSSDNDEQSQDLTDETEDENDIMNGNINEKQDKHKADDSATDNEEDSNLTRLTNIFGKDLSEWVISENSNENDFEENKKKLTEKKNRNYLSDSSENSIPQESINYLNNLDQSIFWDIMDQKDKEIGSDLIPMRNESFSHQIKELDDACLDIIDDLEFSMYDQDKESILQHLFFTEQFIILQKEIQYWLVKADVAVIDNEIREIKHMIEYVIHYYYPLLHRMHCYIHGYHYEKQSYLHKLKGIDKYKKQFQDWIDYLNQPFKDGFATTREILKIFMLELWEQFELYYHLLQTTSLHTYESCDSCTLEYEQKYEKLEPLTLQTYGNIQRFTLPEYEVQHTIIDLYSNKIQNNI